MRYNSWDVINQPLEILNSFVNSVFYPFLTPGAGMAWMISIFIGLAFLMEKKETLLVSENDLP